MQPTRRLQPLSIPNGWKVAWNAFFEADASGWPEPELLVQDLLQLRDERRDLILDLGWQPEEDPCGRFILLLIRHEDWEHPLVKLECPDQQRVVAEIERILSSA